MADRRDEPYKFEYLDERVSEAQEERRQRRSRELEKKQASKRTTEEKIRNSKRRVRFWLCLTALLAVAFLAARTSFHVRELQLRKEEAEARLEELNKTKAQLTEELREVKSDEYVEQQARSELRMIFPGEVLYVLQDENEK